MQVLYINSAQIFLALISYVFVECCLYSEENSCVCFIILEGWLDLTSDPSKCFSRFLPFDFSD